MSDRLPWGRVLLAFALWSGLTFVPYLQAWSHPPAGRWFTGFFHYQDDLYQDLSFVEQARRGQLAFRNKFDMRPHEGFLVNVEWGAAGIAARLLGLGPIGGFHALGFVAALVFVVGVARVLQLGGAQRPSWGLALVLLGGGLGWARLWSGGAQWTLPDLSTTLFPWNQRLAGGPHALLGSGLFLLALLGFVEARAGGSRLRFLLPAGLLGLIRPFDMGLFGVTALALLISEVAGGACPWRRGVGAAADLAWLLPVLFYDWLAFSLHPSFAVWSGAQNTIASPGLAALGWALGPAAALALLGVRRPAPGDSAALLRRSLVLAAACMLALSGLASFGFQFLNSLGGVLLALAGCSLPARWLPAAVVALAPSSLVLLHQALNPSPQLFAPRDYEAAVAVLKDRCEPGAALVAPIDLSLLVAGLTPCHVVLGHWVLTPERLARGEESDRFYDARTSARWRRGYLCAVGAPFAALPAGRGSWLGEDAAYRPLLATPLLELWERSPPGPRAGRRGCD